jgi:hypothetical protein
LVTDVCQGRLGGLGDPTGWEKLLVFFVVVVVVVVVVVLFCFVVFGDDGTCAWGGGQLHWDLGIWEQGVLATL